MQTKKYRVVRAHLGADNTRFDPLGENNVRDAVPMDVAHLVPHVLSPIEDEGEVKPALPENNAASPENKASLPPETQAITVPKRVGRPPAKAK